MKKLLAILLALTLALGMLPGALAEAEAVKIVYAFNGNGMQTDTALVQEALNEWLKSHEGYEHISIELQPYANKELASAITLAQASGEQIDICNSYGVSLGDYVADGYAIPLDDLLTNTDIPRAARMAAGSGQVQWRRLFCAQLSEPRQCAHAADSGGIRAIL